MTEKLKPCPFCGGRPEVFRGQHHFNDVVIRCDSCEAEGPLFDADDSDDDEAERRINEGAAVLHWNTRAQEQLR